MARLKLTKNIVEDLPAPDRGRVIYRDTNLIGFGLRVGKDSKSYFAEKRVCGRSVRITLGSHPLVTCEQARRLAMARLSEMARGVDPIAERKAARTKSVTLGDAYRARMRSKSLRPASIKKYDRALRDLGDWAERPLGEIRFEEVAETYRTLMKRHGLAQANLAMTVVGAVFRYASHAYRDAEGHSRYPDNPVSRLRALGSWRKLPRRTGVIPPHQLPAWFAAVNDLPKTGWSPKDALARDYLILLLLTGLRRQEAARLRWEDVDFNARTLRVPDTKNGEPLTQPMSTAVAALLKRRRDLGQIPWVFPSESAHGYVQSIPTQMRRVHEASGVNFILHDLRRTFITTADRLDISPHAIKRLVGHTTGGDVTAAYVVSDVERLREPMERIARSLLAAAGVSEETVLAAL